MTSTDYDNPIEIADSPQPKIKELFEELETAISDASSYIDQYQYDAATRYCLWPGQDRDGRRYDRNLGGKGKARPWDASSDIRPFTADEIVIERVDFQMAAWRRAQFQITARNLAQIDWSTNVTNLLQWMFRDLLAEEVDDEIELAVQWKETFGFSGIGVWWDQERAIEPVPITIQEMIQKAQEIEDPAKQAEAAQHIEAILDPLMEEKLIENLLGASPALDRRGARRILEDLRAGKEASFPRVFIGRNEPCIEAVRPFIDLFFPVETTNFRKARWIARRRWLTERELKEKISTEQWDKEFCEKAWECRGQAKSDTFGLTELSPRVSHIGAWVGQGSMHSGDQKYAEIWDFTYRALDPRTGISTLYRTIGNAFTVNDDLYARHEPIPYDHGEQPYVSLTRERVDRPLCESRSVPEICGTHQDTIKKQRDSANNYADMTTLPPLLLPLWRSNSRIDLGPTAQIPERTPGELRYLQPPQWTGVPDKIEQQTELALARYFGRPHEGVAPVRTQIALENTVGRFLRQVAPVLRQALQLAQQYLDEVTTELVVGAHRVPLKLSRSQIQGQFALRLRMDPADLNQEMVIAKLKAINELVLPVDTQGAFNRTGYVQMAVRMIDPSIADMLVGTPEQAAQDEVEDEKKNLVMIVAGVEPPMREEGQNYKLRLAALQQNLQANPFLVQHIQKRPDIQAMLNARMQHLEFLAEQYGSNAQIGRVGAEPGLAKMREEQAAGKGALPYQTDSR